MHFPNLPEPKMTFDEWWKTLPNDTKKLYFEYNGLLEWCWNLALYHNRINSERKPS